jgi:hypothetical protein
MSAEGLSARPDKGSDRSNGLLLADSRQAGDAR